ncbi:helix-turn-helix domain-containing protein [Gordonibacter sp.]|uniref:helix-turn-helix domain-containing protein n=1 Tax=Gordonibacter sp. TaxID=1968902 RepID=UPI002FCC3463
MLGYLAFEITALNDFCNAVKARGLSLVRVFGTARFAITAGMLSGWVLGYAASFLPPIIPPVHFAVAVIAIVVTVTSTLVFTEKEVFAVHGVADERILQENPVRSATETADFVENLESFGKTWGMSKREMEVLDLLLKGRNTQYISTQLFIAPGTTKTHIYNIYRKMGIHTKMELLDLFDTFCFDRIS